MDLIQLLVALTARRRLILGGAALVWAGSLAILFLVPNRYTASASFVPSAPKASDLAALSGSLGSLAMSLGMTSAGQSGPEFYASVVKSDVVVLRVLDTVRTAGGQLPAFNYFTVNHLSASDTLRLRDKALRHFRKNLEVDFDPRTSIVTVEFTGRSRELAQWVVHRLLAELDYFNIQTLQTTARAQRRFVERRLGEARSELDSAQRALRDFQLANRQYQQSPGSVLEEARLHQIYDLKTQTVAQLVASLEKTRMDEVRDTPVLTVLNQPLLPARKSGPERLLISLMLGFVWLAGSAIAVLGAGAIREGAARHPEEATFLGDRWVAGPRAWWRGRRGDPG